MYFFPYFFVHFYLWSSLYNLLFPHSLSLSLTQSLRNIVRDHHGPLFISFWPWCFVLNVLNGGKEKTTALVCIFQFLSIQVSIPMLLFRQKKVFVWLNPKKRNSIQIQNLWRKHSFLLPCLKSYFSFSQNMKCIHAKEGTLAPHGELLTRVMMNETNRFRRGIWLT